MSPATPTHPLGPPLPLPPPDTLRARLAYLTAEAAHVRKILRAVLDLERVHAAHADDSAPTGFGREVTHAGH